MRIVALVGADGMGKSTQARRLAERLRAEGVRATCVRPVFLLFDPFRIRESPEPHGAVSPRMWRLDEASGGSRPRARIVAVPMGYVYALLTYAYMRIVLRRFEVLVCDRYFYQYFYDLAGPTALRIARAFPRPDAVFWLDGGLEVLLERIDRPPAPRERPYFDSVLAFYRHLAAELGFARIDARADVESIGDAIWTEVRREVP